VKQVGASDSRVRPGVRRRGHDRAGV